MLISVFDQLSMRYANTKVEGLIEFVMIFLLYNFIVTYKNDGSL